VYRLTRATARSRLMTLVAAVVVVLVLLGSALGLYPWVAAGALVLLLGSLALQLYTARGVRRTHAASIRAGGHAEAGFKEASRARRQVSGARGLVAQERAEIALALDELREQVRTQGERLREELGARASDDLRSVHQALRSLEASTTDLLNRAVAARAATEGLKAQLGRYHTDLVTVREGIDSTRATVDSNHKKMTALVNRLSTNDYAQLEALLDLRRLVPMERAAPALRGWAAAPTTMLPLIEIVHEERPSLVVECGSGASTMWIGHALKRLGGGRCVALEHDPDYAEVTKRDVQRHGLEELVEVRCAPVVTLPIGDEEWSWYDPSAIEDLHGIGVLFVDGPPGAIREQARYPALPVLASRLVPGAAIVLDDAERAEEAALAERWVHEWGAVGVFSSRVEKGVRVLRAPQ
jgi:predicted O-methyltransferase YrrM